MKAYLKLANLDRNMQGHMDCSLHPYKPHHALRQEGGRCYHVKEVLGELGLL
jgi:hypothetical protein